MPFVRAVLSKDRQKYHSLLTFDGSIYADNGDDAVRNRICSQQMNMTVKALIAVVISLFAAAETGQIWTISYYFTQGMKLTTIELKIPFVHDDQNAEYSVNMLLQLIVFVHGFFIYVGMEIVMVILGNVVHVTPRLIKSRLNELDKMHETKEISETQRRFAFLNITKQMLDYER